MRIALFNIDSLASNDSTRALIERSGSVVYLGLSPPFRRGMRGALSQSLRHLSRSGVGFSAFLWANFLLPRQVSLVARTASTIAGYCRERGIPAERVDDVNSPDMLRRLEALGVDLIVSSYFDQIFKGPILDLPRHGVLNVHASPLPLHRGPMPVIYGCLADPPRLGVSIHRIEAGIDTGPILAQAPFRAVSEWVTAAPTKSPSALTLMRLLQDEGMRLLLQRLPDIAAGSLDGLVQTGGSYEGFPDRATLRRLGDKGYSLIDRSDIRRALATPISI